jgi:hypothetical protein
VSWYYNTESGALTSAGAVQSLLQDVQSAAGLGAGWHKLNIPATDTEAQAAAAAKQEFPSGATPTTSVTQQATQAVSQEATGNPATFSSIQNALSAFYDKITDGKMWRSLGWLLLGVILLLTGIGLLIGPSAARRSPLGVAADFARRAYG